MIIYGWLVLGRLLYWLGGFALFVAGVCNRAAVWSVKRAIARKGVKS